MSQIYQETGLNFHYYPQFLHRDSAQALFQLLEGKVNFGSVRRPKTKFRTKVLYGNPGLIYRVTFGSNTVVYPVIPWENLPVLMELKQLLEKLTGNVYNCCVIQRYPHGNIGMNKHRDKEMIKNTTICGVSLGADRTFCLSRGNREINISLTSGSLYLINPPTNDFWCHQILKDGTDQPRISLTFRNYAPN